MNDSGPNARWLAVGIVLLLGVSTAVAAVRNSDDGNGNGHDEAPAAAPAPAEEPDVARAGDETDGDRGDLGEAPATEATPSVEPVLPLVEPAPVATAPVRKRLAERSVSGGMRPTPPAPSPGTAASPQPTQPTQPAPAAGDDPGFEGSSGSTPPPAESGQPAPPPSAPETDDPEATPAPPPGALIDVTAAIRFEPVRFVVVVASNPEPDVDVTVGNDRLIGDAPPPERTEVGIGGELIPPSTQSFPAWQGPIAT